MFEIMPYGRCRMTRYDPFREIEEMTRRFWSEPEMTPFRTDITEKDGVYTLEAELPGFSREDISVDLQKDMLTITAERRQDSEEESDDSSRFVRRERFYGSYTRSFNVRGIDTDKITAEYKDGVLRLTMPAKTPVTPPSRKLEIS